MAKDKTEETKSTKPKKQRWYHQLAQAYTIAKRSYPWIGYAVFGSLFGLFAVGILVGVLTGHWILWPLMGLMTGMAAAMGILTVLVRNASYKQIENMPGATGAVLSQLGRGWVVSEEPVRFNARSQDLVFRIIGRPGIVLISEGPSGRVERLLTDERRAIRRIAPSAPVHTIQVGHDEGQVTISKLQSAVRKLPKQISNQEVAALTARLDAVGGNNLPIPKGIDPMKARPSRRAMRGK